MTRVVGLLLSFEFRQQVVHKEPCVVLTVDSGDHVDQCRWRECAGKHEVAEALRRLADRLEGKL